MGTKEHREIKEPKEVKLPPGVSLRADGRYMGRFVVDGEHFTLYDRNLKRLVKKMQEKRYEVEHGFYCKETDITVEGWFETWLKEYKENSVKVGTIEAYNQNFLLYIKPELGKRKLAQVRPEHIQKLLNNMTLKYATTTINLTFVILNGMYKQAYKNRLLSINPMTVVVRPKKKGAKKKIRVLSMEEQKLFVEYAKDSTYYDLYMVALNTGMRLGELRGLMWSDIDFKNKVIHVQRTMKYFHGKGTTLDSPKTESSNRDIPMLDNVYRILKSHRLEQKKMKMYLGEKWINDFPDLVFTNPWGRHISDTAVNNDMKKIEDKITASGVEFEHIYPHVLRHTFATRGLEQGIPPKVMQELLGHTSITMTLDIYSHVLPDTKAKELEKIASLFA